MSLARRWCATAWHAGAAIARCSAPHALATPAPAAHTTTARAFSFATGRDVFVDRVRMQAVGGRGGKGLLGFESLTNIKKRPTGGNGGRGGDVIIKASVGVQDLSMPTHVVRGRDGTDAAGRGGNNGRAGKARVLLVPLGTVVKEVQRVYDIDVDDEDDDEDGEEGGGGSGGGGAGEGGWQVVSGAAEGTASPSSGDDDGSCGGAGSEDEGEVESTRGGRRRRSSRLRARRARSAGADAGGEGGGDDGSDEEPVAASLVASAAATPSGERAKGGGGDDGTSFTLQHTRSGVPYRERLITLADLDTHGQSILVARGGASGIGNKGSLLKHSEQLSSVNKPHISGDAGENRFLELELKMIADVGLVGFPNAGKSSFVGAVTKAKPKVADYPFTTLKPTVGVIHFGDSATMTIADIPGLIEGAADNRGLGHQFLRHIERTKLLVYLIEASGAASDPVADLSTLQNELRLYDASLLRRPSIVVANKVDLPGAPAGVTRLRGATALPVLEASALTRRNVGLVVDSLRWLLEAARKQAGTKAQA